MGMFKRKVVYSGDMSVDPAMVRRWEEAAAISGKPLHIPGGVDPTVYVKDQEQQGRKEAAEFRKRISKEYAEMQKGGEKPDKKVAESRAREFMKKKFKWK